ncbi:hypothetical protein SEVIR_4G093100v4 [Setaria viridis]
MADASRSGGIDARGRGWPETRRRVHTSAPRASTHAPSAPPPAALVDGLSPASRERSVMLPSLSPHAVPAASRRGLPRGRRSWRRRPLPPWRHEVLILVGWSLPRGSSGTSTALMLMTAYSSIHRLPRRCPDAAQPTTCSLERLTSASISAMAVKGVQVMFQMMQII